MAFKIFYWDAGTLVWKKDGAHRIPYVHLCTYVQNHFVRSIKNKQTLTDTHNTRKTVKVQKTRTYLFCVCLGTPTKRFLQDDCVCN